MDHANFEVLGEILTSINKTEREYFYKEFMITMWNNVFPEESFVSEKIVDRLIHFEQNLLKVRMYICILFILSPIEMYNVNFCSSFL
jgi:hypothetical protein